MGLGHADGQVAEALLLIRGQLLLGLLAVGSTITCTNQEGNNEESEPT